MQRLLQQWLSELRRQEIVLSGGPGAGANENLWSVAIPSSVDVDASKLAEFLQQALEIRRGLVHGQKVHPATFYAWHDEVAGQLRFSTARCATTDLPFSATLELIHDPEEIVREFLDSRLRDGISWADLKKKAGDLAPDEPAASSDSESPTMRVWAVDLST